MNGFVLSPDALRQARQDAGRSGRTLFDELEASTGLDPRHLAPHLASLFSMPVADMADMHDWTPAFDLMPLAKALQRVCVLFRHESGLIGTISDPFDTNLQVWIEALALEPVEFQLALRTDIQAYLVRQEEDARAMVNVKTPSAIPYQPRQGIEDLSLQKISEDTSHIVRLVNSTLYDALKAGASDIHLECSPAGVSIKYRIDGILDAVTTIAGSETVEQVISRIKVMAALDIAERRIPQDGRFRVSSGGRNIDIRVSVMPSIHGEDVVLRILDKRMFIPQGETLRLDMLGFDEDSLLAVRRLVSEPYGMLLVTGPTGSGKTTTLYAAISEINHGRDKIITIEDPVEYELPGVLQIPVNEKKGLTFALGLRSILRHDPDKIMVGEIRDKETAEIAVQSALTGHLVLTTVHANNVFDVFNRFTHMGIDPYTLTSALNGIWAQRLVRLICPRCAADYVPEPRELAAHGLTPEHVASFHFRSGKGCGDCRGTGYKGRKAIAEILSLNDRLRGMIAAREPVITIKEEAQRNGTRYLRDAAMNLVRRGETTLEEVARVSLSA